MGAKASLVDAMGARSALAPSLTLENIQAAYKEGEESAARELIQRACCLECSAGEPHINGVSTPKIHMACGGWAVVISVTTCVMHVENYGYCNMLVRAF